jgi:cephalosporin hydroxylase
MNKLLMSQKQIRLDFSFEDLEKRLCGTGQFEFFGCPMNQIPQAIRLINFLLHIVKPQKIFDFGTGLGGLSVLLSLYANIKGIHFQTYDASIHNPHIIRNLINPSCFRQMLLNDPNTIHEITHAILQAEKAPVILLCDALKSEEFSRYAPFCKKGDFLLVHDYSRTKGGDEFKRTCQKYNWTAPQEQCYENIKLSCEENGVIPFMHDEFEDVLWFCGVKTKDRKTNR